jgi:hypothetical protein
LIQEDKEFLMREYKVQKELVYKKAEEYLTEADSNLRQDFVVKGNTNIVTESQNNI